MLQGEREVVFCTGTHQLGFKIEGKNVVDHTVIGAVMLVQAARLRVVYNIVLGKNIAGALIKVDSPTAISEGTDVVQEVVFENRSRRDAQQVDAAHIGEQALADVFDAVVLDEVVVGKALPVAPRPAHRDARVVEVTDGVVEKAIIGGLADPYAGSRRMEAPSIGDKAVLHGVVLSDELSLVTYHRLSELHATGTKVG